MAIVLFICEKFGEDFADWLIGKEYEQFLFSLEGEGNVNIS